MFSEPVKIILRLFRERPLESGLLIIAVALGIGAFSAGLSLIMNTIEFSNEVLSSPEYRELVVSTRGEADEMETPVLEKPVRETAVLTMSDLDAAELAPHVAWAYIQNHDRLHLITADSTGFSPPPGTEVPENGEAAPEEEDGPVFGGFQQITEEEIEAAAADDSIIIPEIEEISGYSVTPQFFDSWDINVSAGSLFSEADLNGTDNIIILGSELAALLAGDETDPSDLLGKKLLARQGYQTIIGIMEPVSEEFDADFFSPYQDPAGGMRDFRRMFMDSRLRFAVNDPAELDSTALLLGDWFENQFGDAQIVISNPRAEAEQLVARNKGIGILIMFLSAAGFFIALVNVSNILMSRVLRMKKNAGVLMSLGSSRTGIMRLFLTEAVIIAVSGALAGAILSVPLGNYMRSAAGIDQGSWLYTALGAILAGVLTGLFGLIPSRQYMKIDPAQAMRSVS